jgi:hypothetical protein
MVNQPITLYVPSRDDTENCWKILVPERNSNPRPQNRLGPAFRGIGVGLYHYPVLSVPDSKLCISCGPLGNHRFNLETIETRRFRPSGGLCHLHPTCADSRSATELY